MDFFAAELLELFCVPEGNEGVAEAVDDEAGALDFLDCDT